MSIVTSGNGCNFGGQPGGDPCCVDIGFFSKNTTNQSIPTSTFTWLDLTFKRDENPVGSVDLTANRWTCPEEGRYSLTCHIQMDCYAGYTTCALELWKNTAMIAQHTDYNTFDSIHAFNLCVVDWYDPGDYFRVRIWQDSGLTANLLSSSCDQNFFSGAIVYKP